MNAVGRWVHRGLLSPTSSDVDQLPASTDSNGAQAPCPMPRTTAAPYAASHSRTLCREPGRSKLPAHHGRFRRGSTGSCDPQTPGSCRRSADPCRSLIGATRSTIRRLDVAGALHPIIDLTARGLLPALPPRSASREVPSGSASRSMTGAAACGWHWRHTRRSSPGPEPA